MQSFNGTSWSHNDDRVIFSNGFAHLDGPIWEVDCSEKYRFKSTKAGVRIIIDPGSNKGIDLILTDGDRLIFKQGSPPTIFDRIK